MNLIEAFKRAWDRVVGTNRKPHTWTGVYCMDKHWSPNGNMLPPCRWCKYCGLVPYPYTQSCSCQEDLNADQK